MSLLKLATLEGFPISGLFHVRHLRRFILWNGTTLAMLQETLSSLNMEDNKEWQDLQRVLDEELELTEDLENDE